MNKLPNLMTPQELMAYLRCSKKTAYDLCKRRDFPSFRVGKLFYIKSDELAAWIEKECRKCKIL